MPYPLFNPENLSFLSPGLHVFCYIESMRTVPYSDVVSYYVDRRDRRAVDLGTADVPEAIVLDAPFIDALIRRFHCTVISV
jgi:hypothetical protein